MILKQAIESQKRLKTYIPLFMFSANPDLKQNVDAECDILKAIFDYFFTLLKYIVQ